MAANGEVQFLVAMKTKHLLQPDLLTSQQLCSIRTPDLDPNPTAFISNDDVAKWKPTISSEHHRYRVTAKNHTRNERNGSIGLEVMDACHRHTPNMCTNRLQSFNRIFYAEL